MNENESSERSPSSREAPSDRQATNDKSPLERLANFTERLLRVDKSDISAVADDNGVDNDTNDVDDNGPTISTQVEEDRSAPGPPAKKIEETPEKDTDDTGAGSNDSDG